MNTNSLRRLNWLWKNRHTHDGDTTQTQITVIQERVDQVEDVASQVSSGAHVRLIRTTDQTISSAGEAISWTDKDVILPINFDPSLPSTTVTIIQPGYYNVAVAFDWDTFEGGGTVTVKRTSDSVETTVWPPSPDTLWTATTGSRFEGVAHAIPCNIGDTLEVVVDPGASNQTLASASLAVYLVDVSGGDKCSYPQTVIADNPTGYWRLGESTGASTAEDFSGNAHDGTYNGAALVFSQPGAISGDSNTAVQFTEATATDYVNVGDLAVFEFNDTDPFTLEAWVKVTDNLSDWRVIVQKTGFGLTPSGKWLLGVEATTGAVRFRCIRQNGSGFDAATTAANYALNTFYHVVGVYDGTDITVYVDAVEAAQTASSRALVDSTGPVRIGRGEGAGVDGVLDEVAIYDAALDPAQIADHYHCGRNG